MQETLEYKTKAEKETLIKLKTSQGLRLKEEQLHYNGNFLIFTDEPEEPSLESPLRNPEAEIDVLKARLEKLEEKSWLKKLLSKRHTK